MEWGPFSQRDRDLRVDAPVEAQHHWPPHPSSYPLRSDKRQEQANMNPPTPPVEEHRKTTRSPFFSSKVVICSRQEPSLGCLGPKETFTTKLYTSENKWAFILEGNPARLFIILHHNHKVGFNLCNGMPLSWPTGRLRWLQWGPFQHSEKHKEALLLEHFSRDPLAFFFFFWHVLYNFKAYPFLFSLFLYFPILNIPGAFQRKA